MNTPIVVIRDVSLQHRRGDQYVQALSQVSLELSAGEFVALVGPSGSGKSSLLSVLGLITPPDTGSVLFGDVQIDLRKESTLRLFRKKLLGFIFQRFHLLPTLTALENVMITQRLNGVSVSAAKKRAFELLEVVGLQERAAHMPAQLSGGEMQRVAVCRALAHKPQLVLADEPTGNLDSASGATVLSLLRSAANDGTTVLMATHRTDAAQICGRVLHISDGRLSS